MNRLLDALFGVHHVTIFFIVVWIGMAIVAGDAVGFWQPDYRRLVYTMIVIYWAGVICGLGIFRRRRNRR
jgi:tetrahydromethanopterin S-methyltransferase subunit D